MKKHLILFGISVSILFTISSCEKKESFEIPTDGLVAYYPFNHNLNDESGLGNDATAFGASLTSDRFNKSNSAFIFDGNNDYINLNSEFDYAQRSVNLWFYAEYIDHVERHLYISDNPNLNYGFTQIKVKETDNIKEVLASAGISGNEGSSLVSENEWYMITITVDQDKTKQYLNGKLIGEFETGTINSNNGESVALLGTSRVFDRFFKGKIDDVLIYSRALNETEINIIYVKSLVFRYN